MFTVGERGDILRVIYVGGCGRIRITSSRGKLLRRLTHLRLLCGHSMPSSSKTYLANSILKIVSANKFVTCQLACVGTFQQVYVGDCGRIGNASSQGKLLRHLGHLRLLCVKSTLSSRKPRPENMFCEGICDMSVGMSVYSWHLS